jgi:heme exporter protein B
MSGRRPPGFLRSAATIAGKDLRCELRTWDALSGMLLFALVLLLIFRFAFGRIGNTVDEDLWLVPGILWAVTGFASLIAFSRSFQAEERHDTLAALLDTPIDPSALFLGKLFANLLLVLLLGALTLLLTGIFFAVDLRPGLVPLLGVGALNTLGLSILGTLSGAIATRVRRGEAVVAVLLFPLATPLFLSAVRCTREVLERGSLSEAGVWIAGSAAFDLLFLALALWVFEYVVER